MAKRRVIAKWGFAALTVLGLLLRPSRADAQQHTFHLDRLEVPGAPEDGLVLFRPVTHPDPIFYTQLAVGFAIDPLRMRDITDQTSVLRASPSDIITTQFSTYMSAGFELLDRLTLGATLPIAWEQSGNQPVYPFTGSTVTNFSTTGPAVGDMRLDGRYVLARNEDRTQALGLLASIRADGVRLGHELRWGWLLQPPLPDADRGVDAAPFPDADRERGHALAPGELGQ